MQRMFHVRARWDSDAKRFYSESDIIGLHIEAATVEEFEAVMNDVATDLIFANHYSALDLANKTIKEMVPAIVWQRPEPADVIS
jgi:hypothetical protein